MATRGTTRHPGPWFRPEREGWLDVWHLLYLLTLGSATVVVAIDADVDPANRVGMIGFAVANATWYLLIVRRWRYWDASPASYAVLLGVAAALWVPLLRWHPAYGWTAFAAYGIAACPWLRRAIPTVVCLTAILAVLDHTDGTRLTIGGLSGLVAVGAVVLLAHATIGGIARESDGRRRMIDELEATRAVLARREHQAGVLEERQRLARDIHDSLAQGFAGIATLLEAADARISDDAIEVRTAVEQARRTARDSLAETRRLVWALRDDQDDPRDALLAALERLADRTRATGLGVEVVETGTPEPLGSAGELTLLRTAQEAVANATHHADATRITITLSWLGHHVILDVADDGRGFDPDRGRPRPDRTGLGLSGLRERAAAAGARLDIDARPGQGTTITLDLPLDRASSSHEHVDPVTR